MVNPKCTRCKREVNVKGKFVFWQRRMNWKSPEINHLWVEHGAVVLLVGSNYFCHGACYRAWVETELEKRNAKP